MTDTLYVGGTELNIITGERLKDLFTTDAWQDHFTFLSDSLGFSLSIYSQTGKKLFAPVSTHPLCWGLRSSSSDLPPQCKAYWKNRIEVFS